MRYHLVMNSPHTLLELFQSVSAGTLTPADALRHARFTPFLQTLDGVTVDTHRQIRTGLGETVFGEGKDNQRLLSAITALWREGTQPVLATRISLEQGVMLQQAFPQGEFWEAAGVFSLGKPLQLTPPWPETGRVVIVSAGAADMRVALEAFATCRFHDISAALACDIGVSGLHRIRPWLTTLDSALAIIVIAGMEGALPGVIAGFTRRPVLAVPTSIGYGVSQGGYVALCSMLASCVPGMAVFNIDNGYGAAMFAARMQADAS